eukprot:4293354-Pyramimonas_sp.AAC.1
MKKKDPWAVSLEADKRKEARDRQRALISGTFDVLYKSKKKKMSLKPPAFLSRLYPGMKKNAEEEETKEEEEEEEVKEEEKGAPGR